MDCDRSLGGSRFGKTWHATLLIRYNKHHLGVWSRGLRSIYFLRESRLSRGCRNDTYTLDHCDSFEAQPARRTKERRSASPIPIGPSFDPGTYPRPKTRISETQHLAFRLRRWLYDGEPPSSRRGALRHSRLHQAAPIRLCHHRHRRARVSLPSGGLAEVGGGERSVTQAGIPGRYRPSLPLLLLRNFMVIFCVGCNTATRVDMRTSGAPSQHENSPAGDKIEIGRQQHRSHPPPHVQATVSRAARRMTRTTRSTQTAALPNLPAIAPCNGATWIR